MSMLQFTRRKRFLSVTLILLALFSLPPIHAEAAPRISAIEIEGNQSISKESVRAVLISSPGQEFSTERVRRDIQALFGLGKFRDIQVKQRRVSGGIILTYILEEITTISAIEFEGNKKLDDAELLEIIVIKPFDVADPSRIAASIQAMKEKYAEEGHHLVIINHSLQSMGDDEAPKLIFDIKEHSGVRVKRVNFVGNKAFSDDDLRGVVKTKARGYFSWLTGRGKYQKEIIERDVAFLTFHYLNNGYIKVKVSPPRVYLSKDRRWLYIDFTVDEGPQYTIGNVDVVGDILTTRAELLERIKTRTGQIYSRKVIEEDMIELTGLYGNEAYAFANIVPQTIPNDETLTADIVFQINKGSKIKIERINIEGNTITRDKVIRRELEVVEDGYYHEDRLRRSRQRLMALGYFEEVNFATPRGSTDDQLILNVKVKEKPTGTFSIGAGFSSVENFILTASLSKDNFLGYGVSSRFSLEFSSKRQLFLLSLEDPYFLDTPWILGLSAFRTVNAFEDFDRQSLGGRLTLGRRVFDYSRVLLGYSFEDVEARDFVTTIPEPFRDNLSGLTSSLSLTLSRDNRDNRMFPTKGSYVSVSNEFAGVGGDNEFYRVVANGRVYRPLFWKLIFKQNFTIGYIKSMDDNPVPLFERFFTGGVNSLRGFELRSVGPSVRVADDPDSGDSEFVIGGNKLLLFNTEFEMPLYGPAGLMLVSFFDAGNAYGEADSYDLSDLRFDYGFGMRWNSPFGPMRFEWGFPINKRPGDDSIVFNFTIGSFF